MLPSNMSAAIETKEIAANSVSSHNVATVDGTATTVLSANERRRAYLLQNVGDKIIYLSFGSTPTTTSYHVALKACSTAHDGSGGYIIDDVFPGAVNAIASASGGKLSVVEYS